MTPELIEAAAKLCGWSKDRRFTVQIDAVTGERVLSDTGLLALEDALLRRGWKLDWYRLDGYWWLSPHTKRSWYHDDRAIAACLAAQAELEGK